MISNNYVTVRIKNSGLYVTQWWLLEFIKTRHLLTPYHTRIKVFLGHLCAFLYSYNTSFCLQVLQIAIIATVNGISTRG